MSQAVQYISRGKQRTRAFPVASGAVFKAGQILKWKGTGVDRHAASDANMVAKSSTNLIVGMAVEDSTKSDGTLKAVANVIIAEPGTEFQLSIYHGTPASAVASPNGQLGVAYELRNVAGNYDSVDISATVNVKAVITDYETVDYPTWPGTIPATGPGSVVAGTIKYPSVWVEFCSLACACTAAGQGV